MKLISDLISAVKARQNEIMHSFTNGYVKNFEDYQRLVGQFHGLQESLDILDNLMMEDEKHER